MKAFYIYTIGCQMNEYDSKRLSQILIDAGWSRADEPEHANLLLVNTCTVRQLAEAKAFSQIGRYVKFKGERPEIVIGMVGCLAQHLAGEAFRRAPGLDFLAGPRALRRVPEMAESARMRRYQVDTGDSGFGAGVGAAAAGERVASVAVMEGCDQYCTYCAVPKARGRETSRPVEDILEEVRRRITSGAREIILLGQNVNRYGRHPQIGMDFPDLLRQVVAVPGLMRLRFLTGHPKGFSDRLIAAMAELQPICEALHLPLQSGSDPILKAMHRGYTASDYIDLTRRLRAAIPKMTFTTDVIVGFPGETEADFQATLALIREIPVDLAYCFKYSPRPGTAAAQLPEQIPQEVKEERLSRLLDTIRQLALASHAALVGETEQVLVEVPDPKRAGRLRGRSRTNRWIQFDGPVEWIGREVTVRITAAEAWTLHGECEPIS